MFLKSTEPTSGGSAEAYTQPHSHADTQTFGWSSTSDSDAQRDRVQAAFSMSSVCHVVVLNDARVERFTFFHSCRQYEAVVFVQRTQQYFLYKEQENVLNTKENRKSQYLAQCSSLSISDSTNYPWWVRRITHEMEVLPASSVTLESPITHTRC